MGTRYYSIVCSTFFKLKNIYSVILEALCFKNGEGFVLFFFAGLFINERKYKSKYDLYI